MRLIDADALDYELGTSDRDIYVRECLAEAPIVVVEPHWIPCSGGLPKEEGFYLVTLEDECGAETTIRFFRIENGERQWSLWGNENITAWMPKPEPYKGVTE
jgi:hypothetical protein